MPEVEFVFDHQLIAALENLIKKAKHRLLLISPFIDLDKRIEDALRDKMSKHDFELRILFGKNEGNYHKSIKRESLDFFKQFPNVEIRYNNRLHAKFYQNDFEYIMTSLNLYDYSLANNIEVGVKKEFASKGIIGKVADGTNKIIRKGINKISEDILGEDKEVDPIEKFQTIFNDSELKYKTEARIVKKNMLAGKKLDGYDIVLDEFSAISKPIYPNEEDQVTSNQNFKAKEDLKYGSAFKASLKTKSATQLAKENGISVSLVNNIMQNSGLIKDSEITSEGLSKGLIMKKYMGNDYIAYPVNLPVINQLRNKT